MQCQNKSFWHVLKLQGSSSNIIRNKSFGVSGSYISSVAVTMKDCTFCLLKFWNVIIWFLKNEAGKMTSCLWKMGILLEQNREEERVFICTGKTVFAQEEIQQWAGHWGRGLQKHLGSWWQREPRMQAEPRAEPSPGPYTHTQWTNASWSKTHIS